MTRLWVFDDDAEYLAMCVTTLRESGFEVVSFNTAEAVANAVRNPGEVAPDCAILDIQVGNAGDNRGFFLCDDIRDRWPSVAVFFMTSYTHGTKEHEEATKRKAIFISKYEGDSRKALANQIQAWVPEDKGAWRYVGSLWIHLPSRRFLWRHREVELDPAHKEIVLFLTRRPGVIYSYADIQEGVGLKGLSREDLEEDDPPERAHALMKDLIQQHVTNIRAAFGAVESLHAAASGTESVNFSNVLKNERSVGYCWIKI